MSMSKEKAMQALASKQPKSLFERWDEEERLESLLMPERKKIATEAMEHARKILSYGSVEELNGEKSQEKIFAILEKIYKGALSRNGEFTDLATVKLAIEKAIVELSKANEYVELTHAEKAQAKAMISLFLVNKFCRKESLHDKRGSALSLLDIARTNHMYELAKTGYSSSFVNLMIAYLLKNHRNNLAIYPIGAYDLRQEGGRHHPYDYYQVVLLGKWRENMIVCDALRGQIYPYNEREKFAPEVWRDVVSDSTADANEVTFYVGSADSKSIANLPSIFRAVENEDLGVTPAEMERWVEGFYCALTAPRADASFLPQFQAASAAGSASAAAFAAAPSSGAAPADSEMAPLLEPEAPKAEPQVRKRSGWFSGWF